MFRFFKRLKKWPTFILHPTSSHYHVFQHPAVGGADQKQVGKPAVDQDRWSVSKMKIQKNKSGFIRSPVSEALSGKFSWLVSF